jgi:hypothetical protein
MEVIQIQIVNFFVDDVLWDDGLGVNVITKKLKATLGVPKP